MAMWPGHFVAGKQAIAASSVLRAVGIECQNPAEAVVLSSELLLHVGVQHQDVPFLQRLESQTVKSNHGMPGVGFAVRYGNFCLQSDLLLLAEHCDGHAQLD